MIEFPAVTVCNLNIMKVSQMSEDPKYSNLGRIDNKIEKEVQHLLKALYLEETQGSAAVNDDDELTGHGEDSATKTPDRKILRYDWTLLNRKTPDTQNRPSTKNKSSNATAREPRSKGSKPAWTNSTSNESGIEPSSSGLDSPQRNKKNAEFNVLADLKDFKFRENNFGAVSNDNEFDQLMAHSMTNDYSDMFDLLKPTSQDLEKYGHKAKDFIIQCSMDSRNCSYRYLPLLV